MGTKLGELPDSQTELLEAGVYEIAYSKHERKQKESDGNTITYPYLETEFKVVAGERKDATIPYITISLSPKALWRLKGLLLGFGHNPATFEFHSITEGADGKPVIDQDGLEQEVLDAIRGRSSKATITVKEPDAAGKAQGWRTKNEITEFNPSNDVPWDE